MKKTAALLMATMATIFLVLVGTGSLRKAGAAEGSLPGMCNGRNDPNLVVTAHANGKPSTVPKFILNVSTDATGKRTGSLVLERGRAHIVATDFCRVWQHLPGQPAGGDCESGYPAGAITAHAVALTRSDGQTLLIRADVRKLADGQKLFRVRYRTWAPGTMATAADSGGCEESGWTRIPPGEGWDPLNQMSLRVTTSS